MKTIELLERAWKWHKQGNNDIAWHDVHAALIQLREEEAVQQGAQADECQEPWCELGGFHEFAPPIQICSKCGTRCST